MSYSILVVDDEQDFLDSIRRGLYTSGFKNVHLEVESRSAAALFDNQETRFDVALIDVTMPEMDGVELLEIIKNRSPATECIMVTALNDAEVAVECLKKGAYDYMVKPISRDALVAALRRVIEKRILFDFIAIDKAQSSSGLKCLEAFKSIITRSVNVLKVLKEAELHAMSAIPILITGESGTGKDLLARAIHAASPRASQTFTPVNMTSLPDSLFDAAFCGTTKGAFTGAVAETVGYLDQTNNGTLFMDEIGNIPLEFQAKLLRILEQGEFFRLGNPQPRKVDVRFISATNVDLAVRMAKGLLREDFYYRIQGVRLHLPPLRDRRQDIPLLIGGFLREFSPPGQIKAIDERAMSILMDYSYPGNVRELRMILQAAVNLAESGPITSRHIPENVRRAKNGKKAVSSSNPPLPLEQVERRHILQVYEATGRNKLRTAGLLGIGLNTLRRKLKGYGVE